MSDSKQAQPSITHGGLQSTTKMAPSKKKRKARKRYKVTTLKAPSPTVKAIKNG